MLRSGLRDFQALPRYARPQPTASQDVLTTRLCGATGRPTSLHHCRTSGVFPTKGPVKYHARSYGVPAGPWFELRGVPHHGLEDLGFGGPRSCWFWPSPFPARAPRPTPARNTRRCVQLPAGCCGYWVGAVRVAARLPKGREAMLSQHRHAGHRLRLRCTGHRARRPNADVCTIHWRQVFGGCSVLVLSCSVRVIAPGSLQLAFPVFEFQAPLRHHSAADL